MIPSVSAILFADLKEEEQGNTTYYINTVSKRVQGTCQGIEAVKQSIYNILCTEQGKYGIYSRNYGVRLQKLIGKPVSFAISESKRYIQEAILRDDRITAVDGFVFNRNGNRLYVSFNVSTIFGNIHSEKEVII